MDDPDELNPIWKALADPTRRRLLDLLRERPRTTGELSAEFASSRFAVMKHLAVLEEAGLVTQRAQGRERWHHINVVPLRQVYERWLKPYEAAWAERLLNLKQYVEKGTETMGDTNTQVSSLAIEQEVRINAPASKVFAALVGNIDGWWDDNSRWEAYSRMTIEPQLGGRLLEEWNGGSAMFGIVTRLVPDKVLEITGNHGLEGAATGPILYDLSEQDGVTTVKFSHYAIGMISERKRTGFTEGWGVLLNNLKEFVEEGKHVKRGR